MKNDVKEITTQDFLVFPCEREFDDNRTLHIVNELMKIINEVNEITSSFDSGPREVVREGTFNLLYGIADELWFGFKSNYKEHENKYQFTLGLVIEYGLKAYGLKINSIFDLVRNNLGLHQIEFETMQYYKQMLNDVWWKREDGEMKLYIRPSVLEEKRR